MSLPDVRYRDSGVEWLGDVPEHWEVLRLGSRYDIKLGKMLNEARITGEHLVPYLRNVDVQWDRISLGELPQMDVRPGETERYSVRTGDILVCEGGEPGRAAIVPELANKKLAFQKALHRLRPRVGEHPRFLFYTLYLAAKRGAFLAGANPNTILHLTGQMLSRFRLPRPPVAEQIAIAAFLDRETGRIDGLVEKKRSLIERLEEYRTALITRTVTRGQPPEAARAAGLDPSPRLKASGVEWLGDVPEHWTYAAAQVNGSSQMMSEYGANALPADFDVLRDSGPEVYGEQTVCRGIGGNRPAWHYTDRSNCNGEGKLRS